MASALALSAAGGWPFPASAQTVDDAAVSGEIAAMRAEMARMAARIDALEAQLATAKAKAAAATATVGKTVESAPAPAPAPESDTKVSWKGAPEIEGKGGWSFKPRGRIQIDAASVAAPSGIVDTGTGFGSEVRRAYIGAEGSMPGGFGYRAEIDVAASNVEITDLYLTYKASDKIGFTVGHQKPFWGLEELTSDLFTSFTERAAINTAFGYERRVGASANFTSGPLLLQGGVFTANVTDLNNDGNNAVSVDARAVFMPKVAGGQLHLGGSVHWRELNDAATSVRYRARPFVHTTDLRFVDTGAISATAETGYGLEAAWIRGPLHATGEAHWQHVDRPGVLSDPTFFGGYAEVGMFLTKGDTRGYKKGTFDRVKPAHPVGEGGLGALQVNLRYDYLDLTDAGIVGGTQNGYGLSLVWTPTDYTRFMMNYGKMSYDDAIYPATGGSTSYDVDAFGVRAQVDF